MKLRRSLNATIRRRVQLGGAAAIQQVIDEVKAACGKTMGKTRSARLLYGYSVTAHSRAGDCQTARTQIESARKLLKDPEYVAHLRKRIVRTCPAPRDK